MEMPTEQEMLPKDKYTVFDRKVKRYRKGIHSTLWNILEGWIVLIVCRGAEVDEGQSETQSAGFLERWREAGGGVCIICGYSVSIGLGAFVNRRYIQANKSINSKDETRNRVRM